jgi:SAM-dependent methyltransferase
MVESSYDDLAVWYDAIYDARGKDYATEASALLTFAATRGGEPRSVLDVACGTGRHLAAFRDRVGDVAGADAAPAMLDLARQRLGDGTHLEEADLRTLDLGRAYDLVTCLFSSIGHVADEAELDAAVAAMARHVAPGGLLLIEPWLTPDRVRDRHTDLVTATTDAGVVARAASSHREDDVLVLEFAWAFATPDGSGTAEEHLRMPLFTADRYLAAVDAAGLVGEWIDEVAELGAGRGLLVGQRG